MNKARRKKIFGAGIFVDMANNNIQEAQAVLQESLDEEQEYYENMPESLQGGEKGELATLAIEAIELAIEAIEEIDFSEIEGQIDTASE